MIARLRAEWSAMSLRQRIEESAKLTGTLAFALFIIVLATGCAVIEEKTGAAPYVDLGVGYQLDTLSHWTVRTDRPWQCGDNLQGLFAVGLDWGRVELEYFHQSWIACGSPFNDRNELSYDSLNLTYRFGGK